MNPPRYAFAPSNYRERVGRATCPFDKVRFHGLDMIALEHPALNLTIVEVEDDGVHYRMRFGTPLLSALNEVQVKPPKTDE